jgi:hypothetical protein
MRLERQHCGWQSQVFGCLDQPRKHRLMAAMNAVEIADRQGDRSIGCARQCPLYTHVRFAARETLVTAAASSQQNPSF